ncbi:SprT-like domain-containing protein [Bradyrhizobium stylosanthis]|uniref:SprT-like domain-containing protein n=1 Tax=Bradyrhizobium stylosanthis TaxID=1803665 RepID=A0A560CXE2_9BRAD|nr:SprT-like domain-containing protein [Bradyrhizobium stylosanthis]TWA89534.1 hypothetical protein FBZ96_1192 [Bradyrhizobium stylosanthis]
MTFRLTPKVLETSYDYLRTTPPFNRWKLPPGGDVKFVVIRSKDDCGWYNIVNGQHVIAASSAYIGRTLSLMELMAHEMIHLYQRRKNPRATGHNAEFHKLGRRACKHHGFDPLLF